MMRLSCSAPQGRAVRSEGLEGSMYSTRGTLGAWPRSASVARKAGLPSSTTQQNGIKQHLVCEGPHLSSSILPSTDFLAYLERHIVTLGNKNGYHC